MVSSRRDSRSAQAGRFRAARAKVDIRANFNLKQQAFLNFVLSQYVSVGVGELDQEKLSPLLQLKYYNSIADAVADLGRPDEIGPGFRGLSGLPVPAPSLCLNGKSRPAAAFHFSPIAPRAIWPK
jgi:hypothetical protein